MVSSWKISFYKFLTCAAFHLLLLSLFSPVTILLVWATVIAARAYIRSQFNRILERGLLSFLPAQIQKELVDRSIFDILCDLWFTQQTSVLKVIIKPFFMPIQPDRAVEVLEELSPSVKEKFLTKGIVNILPQNMKGYVVPTSQLSNPSAEMASVVSQEEYENVSNRSTASLSLSRKQSTRTINMLDDSHRQMKELRKNCRKQPLFKPKSFEEDDSLQMARMDSGSSEDTRRSMQNLDSPVKQTPAAKWDRLEFYQKFKDSLKSKDTLLCMVKNNVAIVKDLLQLKKVSVQNVSYRSLFKLFTVFAFLMFLQIRTQHKTRVQIFQIMQVLLGVSTVLGFGSTMGLVFYKKYMSEVERANSIRKLTC